MTNMGGWQTKAMRAKFQDNEHPRDRKGRWIETGATVTVWGGGRGTVVGNVGGGRLEVRFEDGTTSRVHRNYLTVEKSAAGAKPTGKAEARPKPIKVTKPSKDAQDFTPSAQDSRTRVADLAPGTAVLIYGEDEEGNDVTRVGVVRSVTPDPERGQRVELGAGDTTTTVYAEDDDATARPIPVEQLRALNAAIQQGDAGADQMARDLLAAITDADDREAGGGTPDAQPAPESSPTRAGTPPVGTPEAAAPITQMSDKPLTENGWGTLITADAPVSFHADGEIGNAIRRMGADASLDVDGEPLADALGRLATDAVVGRRTSQDVLDRIKAIRSRLPEGGAGRRALDAAIFDMDAPNTPVPAVPDGTPEPLRQLVADLHAVPAVRREPDAEMTALLGILDTVAAGKTTPRRLLRDVSKLRNRRHESVEGKFEIDRVINKAVATLEGPRPGDKDSAPAPAPAAEPEPARTPTPPTPDPGKPDPVPPVSTRSGEVSDAEAQALILDAVGAVSPGEGKWATMTALRDRLGDLPRDQQDRILLDLMVAGRVDIEPAVITGDLKPEDRAAAITVGATPNHQVRLARQSTADPAENVQAPAQPQTAGPELIALGDVKGGDRVTFTVPVTKANVERFNTPNAKRPPKPGDTVTVYGAVDGDPEDVFGGRAVRLTGDSARWESPAGGIGQLPAGAREWLLDDEQVIQRVGQGAEPRRQGPAGRPPEARQDGLFLEADRAGTEEMFDPYSPDFETVGGPAGTPKPDPEPAPPAGKPLTPEQVETRIRDLYAELATAPGEEVLLTQLRPLMGDVPREEVDEALKRMVRTPGVGLDTYPYQSRLTPEDRAATVNIGDQNKLVLTIAAPPKPVADVDLPDASTATADQLGEAFRALDMPRTADTVVRVRALLDGGRRTWTAEQRAETVAAFQAMHLAKFDEDLRIAHAPTQVAWARDVIDVQMVGRADAAGLGRLDRGAVEAIGRYEGLPDEDLLDDVRFAEPEDVTYDYFVDELGRRGFDAQGQPVAAPPGRDAAPEPAAPVKNTGEEQAKELLTQARQAFDAEDFDRALALHDEAVTGWPDMPASARKKLSSIRAVITAKQVTGSSDEDLARLAQTRIGDDPATRSFPRRVKDLERGDRLEIPYPGGRGKREVVLAAPPEKTEKGVRAKGRITYFDEEGNRQSEIRSWNGMMTVLRGEESPAQGGDSSAPAATEGQGEETNAPDELAPAPGTFTPEVEQRIADATAAYRAGLAGDDERGMIRPFADLRDLLEEVRGEFDSPERAESKRLREAATELRDAWDKTHAKQIREQRMRRDHALTAAEEASKLAKAGDLDGALARIDRAESELGGDDWDGARARVRAEWIDPTPLPSTDDGTPVSPPGMDAARRAKLVGSIEEMAAGYAWSGDPGRYIAEGAGSQGSPREGEKEWVDAYIAAHPEVLKFTDKERQRRKLQREAREEAAEKAAEERARELSAQAREAFEDGDYDRALALIDEGERLAPDAKRWDRIREQINEARPADVGQVSAGSPDEAVPDAPAPVNRVVLPNPSSEDSAGLTDTLLAIGMPDTSRSADMILSFAEGKEPKGGWPQDDKDVVHAEFVRLYAAYDRELADVAAGERRAWAISMVTNELEQRASMAGFRRMGPLDVAERERFREMDDQELIAEADSQDEDGDYYNLFEIEMSRRGYSPAGDPMPGSRHDLVDAVLVSDDLEGSRVRANTFGTLLAEGELVASRNEVGTFWSVRLDDGHEYPIGNSGRGDLYVERIEEVEKVEEPTPPDSRRGDPYEPYDYSGLSALLVPRAVFDRSTNARLNNLWADYTWRMAGQDREALLDTWRAYESELEKQVRGPGRPRVPEKRDKEARRLLDVGRAANEAWDRHNGIVAGDAPTSTPIDTNGSQSATVSGIMRAPETGQAPNDDEGAQTGERVRADREEALGDVPADRAGRAGQPGGVLSGAGRPGGAADRGPVAGDGDGGRGRERRVRGDDGPQPDGDGAGPGTGDGGRSVPDAGAGPGGRGTAAPRVAPKPAQGRFRPASQEDLAPRGERAKARANVEAVRTLRMLQEEGRRPSVEERRALARWSGWGSLPIIFGDPPKRSGHKTDVAFDRAMARWESFSPERDELLTFLGDKEWRAASKNTLNAHYTDASIVEAVWEAVQGLGFTGGNVLEPGSGVGTFIGLAPQRAHMTGIELDPTTAAISKMLYPHAEVRNESFADTRAPEGVFDVAVGNVPFGDYKLNDREHNAGKHSIHNHFIIKSLALTRPGGLVAVVTSRYTMDNQNSKARAEMAAMGDLVGAVRLPNGAHQRAAGTDVITDLLIFRKRGEDEEPGDTSWVDVSPVDVNGHPVPINPYFVQHPERVLGEMTTGRGQFTDHDLIVKGDRDVGPAMREALAAVVAEATDAGKGYIPQQSAVDEAEADALAGGLGFQPLKLADRAREHEGYLSVADDGTFTQVVGGQIRPVNVHPSQVEQLTAYTGLRDTIMQLLDEEGESTGDTPRLRALRQELNIRYRAYTSRWEAVSKPRNRIFTPPEATAAAKAEDRKVADSAKVLTATALFRQDPASAAVFALDRWDADQKQARPADILKQRVVAVREMPTSADSATDALAIVLDRFGGEVVLSQIARLLGVDEDEARAELGTSVFEEPTPPGQTRIGRLVPAAAYLSGDVREKLVAARAAAEDDPALSVNVAALEKVLPRDLTPGEIDVRLGAPWIGEAVVAEFLRDILGTSDVKVEHGGGSIWEVQGPKWGVASTSTWGTEDRPAPDIAQALLQQQTIKVTRSVKLPNGDKKSVPDPGATLEAQQKAQEMSERFADWVWENPERAERLARIYNDRFNSIVLRTYDGVNPSLPGLAAGWTPREHQKAAVTRILSEPSVLLAHEVGAGKTAEMVMGAMELRRTGLAKKPAIVVPNHMLEQFSREFLELYPQAKILAASSADLQGDKRREFVARAATGDWDAVILTQRAFEAIDMRPEAQEAYMNEELDKLRWQIARAKEREGKSISLKRLENALQKAEEKLKSKLDGKKDDGAVYFEQSGIDYLMVDEAHHFKNLRTPSRIEGAAIDGSNRASDLHMKLHYLRSKSTSGRVVTLATGTPIANSVTEAFTMLRYLRPDLLEAADIDDFDSWAATFGDVVTDVELNPDGNGFRQKSRFAKFRNVPELLRLYRLCADVKTAKDLNLPTPPVRKDANGNRGETVVVPASEEQLAYIQALGVRAEQVRNGAVKPDEDNMLKISGDGKRAALDMRLMDPGADGTGGKIDVASDRIAAIYAETKDLEYPVTGADDSETHPVKGALQLVFMDQGTPKKGKGKAKKPVAEGEAEPVAGDGDVSTWAAYDEMKAQLVARGVPEHLIRYIHDANTDQQKAKLFEDARTGKIAVLIGSTEKMGTGTNVQARAVALHHMDCPWRPADLAQRDGRIERQGNLNEKLHSKDVQIIRYVTEGTFDGYSWQTVERKAKFIAQLQSGNLDTREIEDVGDSALTFSEVKALATGNPYLMDKAKADADLNKLERLDRAWGRNQGSLTAQLGTLQTNVSMTGDFISQWERALSTRVDTRGDAFTMTMGGEEFTKHGDAYTPLEQAVQDLRDARPFVEGQRVVIGQLGGHDVYAETTREFRSGNAYQVVRVGFDWPRGTSSYLFKDLGEGSGRRLLTGLENRLGALETQIDAGHSQIETWETELGRARAAIGQPFPQTDKLSVARTRARLLTDLINAQTLRDELRGTPGTDTYMKSDEYKAADTEVQLLQDRLEASRPAVVPDPAADPDPDIAPTVVDTTPMVDANGEMFDGTGFDEAEQERTERDRQAAEGLSEQARTAVDEGDFEGALALIDDAEDLAPDARDWDAIRDIVRDRQGAPAPEEQPAPDEPVADEPTPDEPGEPDGQEPTASTGPGRRPASSRRPSGSRPPGSRPPGQRDRVRPLTAPDRVRGGTDPGDLIDDAFGVRSAGADRPDAPDGQVYADQVQAGETISERPADSNVARRVGSAGTYVQPAGPARIQPREAVTRTVTDVFVTANGVKITFDDGSSVSRPADVLLTRGEPAEVLDGDGNQIGEWVSHKLIRSGDRISYTVAGQDLPSTIDREGLGIPEFGRVIVNGRVVRRQPGQPSGELTAVTLTLPDGTAVPVDGPVRSRWPARVIRLNPTLNDDQGQERREEGAPVMPDELTEGDRLPPVAGGRGGTVEETATTPDGDTTLITVRGDDDSRHVRGTSTRRPVEVDDTARDEPVVDETEPGGLTVGDWYLDEDGQTLRVASEPEIIGDRVRYDVTTLDGLTTEVEMDRRMLVVRVSGPEAAPEPDPRIDPPPVERSVATPVTYVPVDTTGDGTTGKLRLRTDQRKRLLELDLDAEGANVYPDVAQAAARLRARKALTGAQMRALAEHLRILAGNESLPAARRRSYGRTAAWVDAGYARLSGFPAPPHDPGRAAPETVYARNLTLGDVIALPDDTNPNGVVFGTVTVVRPVRGFGLVQAHVRMSDGTVAQKVLPDGVDMWVLPDLPDDVDVPPDPDFAPMEHINPDRLEVGDAISYPLDGGTYPVGKVASIVKTSAPFADVDTWQAVLEVLDDNDRPVARETVTLSSEGRPSVVRTWRGQASAGQPWDATIDNSSGDGIVTADQLRPGDRVTISKSYGDTSGTVEMIIPVHNDEQEEIGVSLTVRKLDGELAYVSLIGEADGAEIVRLAKGADDAQSLIHAQMGRDRQRDRQNAVSRALADAETGLYREVSQRILGELDTVPVAPEREREGDEVYQQAITMLEKVWERQPEGLAEQVAVALTEDDDQAVVLAKRLAPTVAEIRDRAATNMVAAIGEVDPLPGETWDRALRRTMQQYRDAPPTPSLARVGQALAAADLGDEDAPLPEAAVDGTDLPQRMAAYRKALPEDLANLGRKQVQRAVFLPATLEDLEAGRTPERDTVTAWVDDVAADGGPGEHAMRHLAVLRAAGADLDAVFQAKFAEVDKDGAEREYDEANKRATKLHAQAYFADKQVVAARKKNRPKIAKDLGYPSMRALNAEADYGVKQQAKAELEESIAAEVQARDALISEFQAAEAVMADARRRVRETRRAAALDAMSQVRDMGGEGLTYLSETGNHLTEQNRLLQAMRVAEASYPADWLNLAQQEGVIRIETGAGHYRPRLSDDRGPTINLLWESEEIEVMRDGRTSTEEAPSRRVAGNNASRASVHELGHHMEQMVPGLVSAERVFHWDRTSTGAIGDRTRNPQVIFKAGAQESLVREGGFDIAYSGREYEGENFFELFTMGIESLMGGSSHLDNDADYRAFTFGAMALLGSDQGGPRRSPLAGVVLSELSEEELRALLAKVWGNDPEMASVMAELNSREQANDPLAGRDLQTMNLDELVSLLGTVDDDYSVARIGAALEALEAEEAEIAADEQARAERGARVDALVAGGMAEMEAWADVHGLSYEELERQNRSSQASGDRLPGETLYQMARRHYDLWLHQLYLQAEADTRGYMLTPEGVAAGIEVESLFSGGRDRARKYATEELRNWFDANGWMNFTQFRAQMLGGERDKKAAAAGRGGRDFNR